MAAQLGPEWLIPSIISRVTDTHCQQPRRHVKQQTVFTSVTIETFHFTHFSPPSDFSLRIYRFY